MPFATEVTSSEQVGVHSWMALRPVGDDWLTYLATVYRELRTETTVPLASIEFEGLSFSTDLLKKTLADACVPVGGKGTLRVERSDFAETISYCLLADAHQTRFGYKSLRDRELTQSTGRGIDAIGIEVETTGELRLVLGETKLSTEKKSPPQVVDTGKDCMRKQHLAHIKDRHITAKKVFDAARRARDREVQQLLFAAGIYLQAGDWSKLRLTSYCCLVRPQDAHQTTDCGRFRTSPNDFTPSHVRFTTFIVPGDVEAIVKRWLDLAQAG